METTGVIYKIKTASAEEIFVHLQNCNNNFHPSLIERVDIREYSQKIFEKAVTFEAWSGSDLVGLVAVYFNDYISYCAYVTNVSVLSAFMGLGIASNLMTECIEYAVQENFKEIILEVNKENDRAIDIYGRFNFKPDNLGDVFVKMRLKLSNTIEQIKK